MLGGLFNNLAAKEGLASSADKKTLSPRMKVFTVGLDQKPPLKNDLEKAEKTSSPPPGYSATTTQHVPLPVGPELPLPPTPLIMRKSRGYKGILLVMLSVFLIALFALTLSEIAYNRQRDENFFRLRWAELKHRLGSYADYDYYFNRNPYTYSINRQKELGQPIVPTSFNQQQQPLMQQPQQQQQSVTAEESTSTSTPVLAEVIDTSKTGSRRPLGADLTSLSGTSLSHSSSSSSQQTSAEQPITLTPSDTRLQFLRSILRRIKQHAEDMGFDGMMQVSVIEVEPQGEELNGSRKLGAPSPAIQQILPGLFSHLIGGQSQQQQQPSHVDEPQMLNVKSDAFLDGFGEIHQPSFLQNNQIAEQNRAHFENNDNNNNHNNNQRNNNDEPPIEFEGPIQWSRVNNPIGAEEFFRPSNWHLTQQQQQQQQPQLQQQQAFPPQFPQVLPRPFEQWSSNGVSDDEFMPRRFGQQPQAPTEPAQAPQHHQISPPMIQVFPQSAPLFFPPPVSQQSQQPQAQPLFNQFPAGQMLGVGADSEFRHFKAIAPPPPPPSVFEFPSGRPQSLEFPPPPQSNGVENNQEMGEMHGGKIGQFVKELIANRLQTLSQLQQQSQQQQQAGQLEQLNPMTFIPPENRIQIEPPMPMAQGKIAAGNNADGAPKATIIDSDDDENNNNNNNNNNNSNNKNDNNKNDKINAGWTHQPQFRGPIVPEPVGDDAISEDSLESVRNFAKMMAAGVAEEATRRRAEAIAASLTSSSSAEPATISKNIERPLSPFFFGPRPAFVGEPITVDSFSASTSAPVVDNEEDRRHDSSKSIGGPKPVPIMPVLSIDSPIVDLPAVRFPMSKEKDAETPQKHVEVVVDRVSDTSPDNQNDDADAHNKPNEPVTKSADDDDNNNNNNNGEQKKKSEPLMNEALSASVSSAAAAAAAAHSNGVFFQVDDPTAIEARPIITV